MLDYSLFRLILTDILEKLQPFKVVQEVKRGDLKDIRVEVHATNIRKPPPGKRWEILSGMISHPNGVVNTEVWCQNIESAAIYFIDEILAATATGYYPLDLRGSRPIIEQGDSLRMFVGNAGSFAQIRVLETDV